MMPIDEYPGSERHFMPYAKSDFAQEVMVVGSPEHKRHIRKEAEGHIDQAMAKVSDAGVFSEDQTEALQSALWEVFHEITKTI